MNKLEKKLALGTAQFGLHYGISNQYGKTSMKEAGLILEESWRNCVDTIDTATAYGDAEIVLGENISHPFKIVSKFPAGIMPVHISSTFKQSLINLKQDSLYGYLAHSPKHLAENPDCWKYLTELKEQGLIKKIGYSLYTIAELEELLDLDMIPGIIQCPYNLLERQFESYFNILKGHSTEIHIRSAFLQGLFFMADKLPSKLKTLEPALQQLVSIAANNNMSVGGMALNFVHSNPLVDKVVVGVNNCAQLIENIKILKKDIDKKIFLQVKNIEVKEKYLLNPVNWS